MVKTHKITDGVKITFYVPREWHEKMEKIAEEKGTPLSVLYRIAIKEYLDNHEEDDREKKSG